MESHMKMLDFASMLWREVTEATYDFRRHHRECEHLNFLTLSKVSRFDTENSAFLNNVIGASILPDLHPCRGSSQEKADALNCSGPDPKHNTGFFNS